MPGWAHHPFYVVVSLGLLLTAGAALAASAAVLLVLRAGRRWRERRQMPIEAPTRALIFDYLMASPEEEREALDALERLGRVQRREVTFQLESLGPHLRGDAQQRARALLEAHGVARRALRRVRSRRVVTRCRGLATLGSLGAAEHVAVVAQHLDDPSRLVRRVAVRALGGLSAHGVSDGILDVVARDPEAIADAATALDQIGEDAVPRLRAHLTAALAHPVEGDQVGPLVARALGRLQDLDSVPDLAEAALTAPLALRLGAIDALGSIESAVSADTLLRLLDAGEPWMKGAAARALGRLGTPQAIPDLLGVVADGDPIAARRAADALLAIGAQGRDALAASGAPYAVEASALAVLRGRA